MENLKLDIVLKDTPIEYGLDRESIVELYENWAIQVSKYTRLKSQLNTTNALQWASLQSMQQIRLIMIMKHPD